MPKRTFEELLVEAERYGIGLYLGDDGEVHIAGARQKGVSREEFEEMSMAFDDYPEEAQKWCETQAMISKKVRQQQRLADALHSQKQTPIHILKDTDLS
jgi:hypothetical protein